MEKQSISFSHSQESEFFLLTRHDSVEERPFIPKEYLQSLGRMILKDSTHDEKEV